MVDDKYFMTWTPASVGLPANFRLTDYAKMKG